MERLDVTLASGAGGTFGVDDLACAAADRLGHWDDAGLDVTWVPRNGGKRAMQAVLDGDADVSYSGLGPVINLRANGEPCRILVSMARALAQNLVASPAIESVDDLPGATWAIDGVDALSHHMARLVVDALDIDEDDIDWEVVGPPPERIEALFDGDVDVSLIRVEEAVSLTRRQPDRIHPLLGFDDLDDLVPAQPHGTLATTEAFEDAAPEVLRRLVRGLLAASRELHEDRDAFRGVVQAEVDVPLTGDEIDMIWQREHDAGGFAVNGELSPGHWDTQLERYAALYPDLREVTRTELLATTFVDAALDDLGRHPADFDTTGT